MRVYFLKITMKMKFIQAQIFKIMLQIEGIFLKNNVKGEVYEGNIFNVQDDIYNRAYFYNVQDKRYMRAF